MSLRAFLALLVCTLAFLSEAASRAFEGASGPQQARREVRVDPCQACCCADAPDQEKEDGGCAADCGIPARAPSGSAHSPSAAAQVQPLKANARRNPARARAVPGAFPFYARFLAPPTQRDAEPCAQVLARATAAAHQAALATPTPARRVTQCRFLL